MEIQQVPMLTAYSIACFTATFLCSGGGGGGIATDSTSAAASVSHSLTRTVAVNNTAGALILV